MHPAELAPLAESRVSGAIADRVDRRGGDLAGAGARPAGLRPQERFPLGLLGLSGGIDSALVAAIAVDAIGAAAVYGVSMPSGHSSEHSRDDAADLAARTGLHYRTEPIQPMVDAFLANIALTGLAVENLQARVRGGDPDGAVQSGGSSGPRPPATRASWRSATRPCTATPSAVSTRSRTYPRRWCAGWPVAQRRGGEPRRDAADPGELDHQAAQRRAAPRPARQRLAARLRPCSTRSWRYVDGDLGRDDRSRPASTRRWSTGSCAWWTWPSTSAASPRRARRSRSRRSAGTAGCPSPTASRAESRPSRCEIFHAHACTTRHRCDDRRNPGTASARPRGDTRRHAMSEVSFLVRRPAQQAGPHPRSDAAKERGDKWPMLTSYDQYTAAIFDQAGDPGAARRRLGREQRLRPRDHLPDHRRRAHPACPRGGTGDPATHWSWPTCRSAPMRRALRRPAYRRPYMKEGRAPR